MDNFDVEAYIHRNVAKNQKLAEQIIANQGINDPMMID